MTRILFIPEAQDVRTSERTPALYRMLKQNHDVVGLPAPWDRFIYDTARARWPRYLLYLLDKVLLSFSGLFMARRYHVELVFCETAHHALSGLVVARILGIRCLWDSHGNVKLFAESVGKGRFFSRMSASLEAFLGRRVDILVTVSEQDSKAYAQMGIPPSKIHVIPTCIDLSEVSPRTQVTHDSQNLRRCSSKTPVLFFFGSFKYRPNLEALEFINASLAPFLERNGIRAEIQVAGRDIPILPLHSFIRVLGFVPDIHACIQSADLCIVPVWKGVGMLTKVIDIMAGGVPVVLSSFAAQGIPGIRDGIHASVASTEQAFLRRVSEALANPEAGDSMAKRARQLVEENYDWESQRQRIDAIVQGEPPGQHLVG